jgi:hypothetical protein
MASRIGEALAVDESFTVEFPDHLPSWRVQFWIDRCSDAGALVEQQSERVFRILCSTEHQVFPVYSVLRSGLADVCRTTPTSGEVEAIFNKYRRSSAAGRKSQDNSSP